MKKLLTILLAASLSISLLAGCGGSGKTAGTTSDLYNEDGTTNDPSKVKLDKDKLVLWSLFSGGDGDFMEKIIEEYNATNPTKKVQSVMLVWADYYTKLQTAVATNKGPDIGISHASKLSELQKQGVIQAFDDEAKEVGVDWGQYTDSMVESVTFDKKHYALPLDTHANIMYFNTDILEQAGVALTDGKLAINNVDEFKAILDQIKASSGSSVSPLSLPQKGDDPYRVWWGTYFQMGGAPLLSENGKKVTFDKETGAKAADFILSLYKDGYIKSGIQDHQKFFQGGDAGLMFGGTWATGAFEKTDKLNFGAQGFPHLFENEACWADAHTMTIPVKKSRSAADTKAAVEFINYVCTTGATTWAGSGQIPSNLETQVSEEYLAMPYRSDYKESAGTAVLPPKSDKFGPMKEEMIRCLDDVWNGKTDSKKAMDNMYQEIESKLS